MFKVIALLGVALLIAVVVWWWSPRASSTPPADPEMSAFLSDLVLAQERHRGFNGEYARDLGSLAARGLSDPPSGVRVEVLSAEQIDYCARARRGTGVWWVVSKEGARMVSDDPPSAAACARR